MGNLPNYFDPATNKESNNPDIDSESGLVKISISERGDGAIENNF